MKNKKELGQNWLTNRAVLEEIAELAAGGAEVCLEIGPGLGYLTTSLLRRFEKVIAVEVDEGLAKNLPGSFPGKNLEVINESILDFDFSRIREKYVVCGNIPYYITSPIIEKVLTAEPRAERVVLLVQKEVAERICGKKETTLSLFVKNLAEPSLGPVVGREEFVPAPKVDSQVIVLEPHEAIVGDDVMKLIRIGFKMPRKKLIHNLAGICSKERLKEILMECEIDENARPGDVSLEKWAKLAGKMI